MNEFDATYSVRVGERVRAIRKQKRLSLHEVEALTEQEFKASVLGAYERGERALSLPRLQRLASFYRVPVDQFLPRDNDLDGPSESARSSTLSVDLERLTRLNGAPFDMIGRFLRMIQVQRQDFNGQVLTIRESDQHAIAAMLDIPVDQVALRFEVLDLVYHAS